MSDLVAKAVRWTPAKVSSGTTPAMCKYFAQLLASGYLDLLQELVDFHSVKVNPRNLVVPTAFFGHLVNDEVLSTTPHPQALYRPAQYTDEKTRAQASGTSYAQCLEHSSLMPLVEKET